MSDGSLTVTSVSREDRGAYTCRAYSIQGEAVHTTHLLVQGREIVSGSLSLDPCRSLPGLLNCELWRVFSQGPACPNGGASVGWVGSLSHVSLALTPALVSGEMVLHRDRDHAELFLISCRGHIPAVFSPSSDRRSPCPPPTPGHLSIRDSISM